MMRMAFRRWVEMPLQYNVWYVYKRQQLCGTAPVLLRPIFWSHYHVWRAVSLNFWARAYSVDASISDVVIQYTMEYCSISTQDYHKSVTVFMYILNLFECTVSKLQLLQPSGWYYTITRKQVVCVYVNFVEWRLRILAILVTENL